MTISCLVLKLFSILLSLSEILLNWISIVIVVILLVLAKIVVKSKHKKMWKSCRSSYLTIELQLGHTIDELCCVPSFILRWNELRVQYYTILVIIISFSSSFLPAYQNYEVTSFKGGLNLNVAIPPLKLGKIRWDKKFWRFDVVLKLEFAVKN